MSATYAPATATERRVSLSRGPALVVGTILLAAGLYFMYRQHTYPRWGNFPNGAAPVDLHIWGVFGVNGFTGLFTAVCGGLLLFGAAEHYMSKTMSLIIGAALGAAAIIGVISGNVLGLAASNGWTELGWGIAAAILLINALIPARRTYPDARGRTVGAAGAGAAAGAAAGDMAARRHTRRAAEAGDPAYTGNGAAAGSGATAGAGAVAGRGAATGVGTTAGRAGNGPAEPGATTPAEPGATTPAEPGAATPAEPGAATPAEPGAATPAEPGATTPAGAGTSAAPGRDVTYTHRITGGPEASQPAADPVAAGRANSPGEDRTAGTGERSGGALSRLFGRRS